MSEANGPKKILLVRTDRLGDVILSTPVATALKRRYPHAAIAMLVNGYTREVVEGHPHIDQVLIDEGQSPFALAGKLREQQFDMALALHPTVRLALAMFLARIPTRVGTGYRLYSLLFTHRVYEHRKKGERHELDYNLHLARRVGAELDQVQFHLSVSPQMEGNVARRLAQWGIEESDRLVVLHPGSGGSARNWPARHFAALVDRLTDELDAKVVVTGTAKESGLVSEVYRCAQRKPIRCDAGLPLQELAALLKRADLVIANSTGPLHLAVAVGTEVIGLYCPIIPCLPSRWGPYGREDSVLMPSVAIRCPKCLGPKCQYFDCMDLITVQEVFALAKRKLEAPPKIAGDSCQRIASGQADKRIVPPLIRFSA